MKTYAPKPPDVERRWYVVDAQDAVLGRLATEVASILRGKHKPIFAPNADTGDHVVVVNAAGVRLTGGKEDKKIAYRHSGYPGGLRETKYGRLMRERPAFAVEKAVKGMLPKTRLGRQMARKLHVHDGADHTHAAQKPEPLKLGEVPPWNGLPARPVVEPTASKKVSKPKTAAAKPAAKTTAKKTAAKKTTAKKTTAKKTTAKKSTAKKSTAKKATAKKATAKKTTAKKSTAKKSTAKKTTARKKSDG